MLICASRLAGTLSRPHHAQTTIRGLRDRTVVNLKLHQMTPTETDAFVDGSTFR